MSELVAEVRPDASVLRLSMRSGFAAGLVPGLVPVGLPGAEGRSRGIGGACCRVCEV